jgi:predicted helicase
MSEALAHEALAANDAKMNCYTAIVGNPPYSNFGSANDNRWIGDLTLDFWGDMKDESKVNLYDDYIKFIRLALYFVERANVGVIGLITNRSYLDGSTQREMRRFIMNQAHRIDITDLYRGIYDPDARRDANVFDITTGVAISILSLGSTTSKSRASFSRLIANISHKFDALLANTSPFRGATSLEPNAPDYLFIPTGEKASEYENAPKLPDLFVESTTGVQTNRDPLCVDENSDALWGRIKSFASSDEAAKEICRLLEVPTTGFWSPGQASHRLRVKGVSRDHVIPYAYRPFESQWLYYDEAVVHCPRELVGREIAGTDNLCLLASRGMDAPQLGLAFVARGAPDKRMLKSARGEAKVFPLNTHVQTLVSDARAGSNVALSGSFGCNGDELFFYAYAILNSPSYVKRYDAFLRLDYPRIPIPLNADLLKALVPLGTQLVALHLLDAEAAPELKDPKEVRFAGHGEARVEQAPEWTPPNGGRVSISDHRWFEGVPERVWNFHIGGYQPAQKWLKDRARKGGKKASPGRILTSEDQLHYRRMIVAMDKTIDLMAEIDRVIEQHGGWPGAFKGTTGGERSGEDS